jgi:hypothetical protein
VQVTGFEVAVGPGHKAGMDVGETWFFTFSEMPKIVSWSSGPV